MALIPCPECGNEVSARAPTCPRCGAPIFRESKLIVASPVQTFLVNPKIRVYWRGREVAALGKGESVTIPIDADGEVRFEASVRSARLAVRAGEVTRVQLMWDRVSGKLLPQVVESFTSGHSNL